MGMRRDSASRVELLESRALLASATFTFDPPPGTPNPHQLRFDLDQPAVPNQALLSLTNVTSREAITSPSLTTGTWAGGASALYGFPTYTNGTTSGVLPDGNYFGVFVDTAQSEPQQILLSTDFFVFSGDFDHDRSVNIAGFSIVGSNFNQPGSYSHGDANYDGSVNIADFSIVASKFNTSLGPASLALQLTATPVSTERINFYWSSVSGASTYRIDLSSDGSTFDDSAEVDNSSTVAAGIDFYPGQSFYFRVVSVDGSGTELAVSNTVHATTFADPARPVQSATPLTQSVPRRTDPVLLVPFNGAYLTDTLESDGNRWFERTVEQNGNSIKPNQANNSAAYRYDLADVKTALRDLLVRLDTDSNLVITSAEASNPKIIIMGYSWGALNAANLTIRLKEDNIPVNMGTFTAVYHLDIDIPVDLLLTMDGIHSGPARAVRWIHGKIDTNVQRFVNYYQRRGGTSTFPMWNHVPFGTQTFSPFLIVSQGAFGTGFSSLLKGSALPNRLNPANVNEVNINTLGNRLASNYQWSNDPLNPNVTQFDTNHRASNVEHLDLPWYVMGGTTAGFPTDYNVLRELANV